MPVKLRNMRALKRYIPGVTIVIRSVLVDGECIVSVSKSSVFHVITVLDV